MTWTFEGGEPHTTEGAFEGGFARRNGSVLQWTSGSLQFDLRGIDETTTAASQPTALVAYRPFPCQFTGIGRATLTVFDPVAKRIAGHIDPVTVECATGCFECGGDGSKETVSFDFDMVWLDYPLP